MTQPLRLTLNNDSIEATTTVRGLQRKLVTLLKERRRALLDLARFCRDENYSMLSSSKSELIHRVFLATDGSVPTHVKNVVLCAVLGNTEQELHLVSPVKGEE